MSRIKLIATKKHPLRPEGEAFNPGIELGKYFISQGWAVKEEDYKPESEKPEKGKKEGKKTEKPE